MPNIVDKALRVIEDVCMLTLKAVVHEDILANLQQAGTTKSRTFDQQLDSGIKTEADRLAVGAVFVTHLIEADPSAINCLGKTSRVVRFEFLCPICSKGLCSFDRLHPHLKIVHKMTDELEITDQLSKVRLPKCRFEGCTKEYTFLPTVDKHELFCEFNPNRKIRIECKFPSCGNKSDLKEEMNQHACRLDPRCKAVLVDGMSLWKHENQSCPFRPNKTEISCQVECGYTNANKYHITGHAMSSKSK